MASVRQTRTGKFELTVRHPQLPTGRKFFTFDTETEALQYGERWDLFVKAGLPPPAELLEPAESSHTLGFVLRLWANSGNAAPTEQPILKLLMGEVGDTKLVGLTYQWAEAWLVRMKTVQNLAPSSIRKRVGALSRAIDAFLRGNAGSLVGNPLRLLPDGYSAYNERDQRLVGAAGKPVKVDGHRERRLHPGEEKAILAALTDPDLRMLFLLILGTGTRLKEAYMVLLADVGPRSLRVQTSKQWRGKVKFRTIPIAPALRTDLDAYTKGLKRELLFPFWDGIEPVENVTNRLSKRFKTAFTNAKCIDLTEHDLRHESTCRWYELKDSKDHWMFREEEIVKIMGWAPNSKMPTVYASFRGEDLAERLWT